METKIKTKNLNTNLSGLSYKPNLLLISLTILLILTVNFFCINFSNADNKLKIIAITQIVDHPSLNQTIAGIEDELKTAGYIDGKNIKIIKESAQGNLSLAAQIAQKFVSSKPDVLVPISTPSAQTIYNAAKHTDIPIVFAAVTDPIEAKLIANSNNKLNITGAIDFPPIKDNLILMNSLFPSIKKIGLLYNPSESNSVKIINLLKENIKDIAIIESPVYNSNNLSTAVQNLISKVDIIFVPSDNTVYSNLTALVKISIENKIPVFTTDPDAVKTGFLGCIGYSQYEVGKVAGKQIVEILKGKKAKDIPITHPKLAEIYINKQAAKRFNIQIMKLFPNKKIHLVGKE
jgi:putative ABC transport system substrate-binding protein